MQNCRVILTHRLSLTRGRRVPKSRLLTVTLPISIVTVCLHRRGIIVETQQHDFDAPTAVSVTVPKRRPREYLTETEIERLMEAARKNRQGHRDATAMLIAYRH